MSFNVKALGAFKKLGAVALMVATIFFVACNQTSGGGGTQGAPFVEGGASLILSPDKLNIEVKAKTADGSDIQVEGCKETTLKSDTETTLTVIGTKVILKGNITELSCRGNKLTALNVQGLTALQVLECIANKLTELNTQGCASLQVLDCINNKLTALNVQGCASLQKLECYRNQLPNLNLQGLTALEVLSCHHNKLTELNVQGLTALLVLNCDVNQLNAQAMTKLLKSLPSREASDGARAVLYTDDPKVTEGNCKDYTQPAELKKAVEDAKSRNWRLVKSWGGFVGI